MPLSLINHRCIAIKTRAPLLSSPRPRAPRESQPSCQKRRLFPPELDLHALQAQKKAEQLHLGAEPMQRAPRARPWPRDLHRARKAKSAILALKLSSEEHMGKVSILAGRTSVLSSSSSISCPRSRHGRTLSYPCSFQEEGQYEEDR